MTTARDTIVDALDLESFVLCESEPVGMARCAVPVAERSVRRRHRTDEDMRQTTFAPRALRAGTSQRDVPTKPNSTTALKFIL